MIIYERLLFEKGQSSPSKDDWQTVASNINTSSLKGKQELSGTVKRIIG